jgi:tellurite methyltransferase
MQHQDSIAATWEQRFGASEEEWFFGREPSDMGRATFNLWHHLFPTKRARVLDLGCGEGRDSVFFAAKGFRVTAVDLTASGIRKTQRLAEMHGVALHAVHQMDIRDFPLIPDYDILFSNNTLQSLNRQCIPYLHKLQRITPPEGLNAIRVFTREADALRDRADVYCFDHNELKHYYRNWRLLYYGEDILWRPHVNGYLSFATIIAQKRGGRARSSAEDRAGRDSLSE